MNDRKLKQDVLSTVRQLKRPEEKVYLVGGAIRDQLLRIPIHDLDFAVSNDPLGLARKVAEHFKATKYVMDDIRQTVRVILNHTPTEPVTLDFALMRGANIEDDLRARDFTINAIAIDVDLPRIYIDPLMGRVDLKENILRLCSPSSLVDDPIRSLRVIRFSISLGFAIPSNLKPLIKVASSSLVRISPERKRDEVFQILSMANAAEGIELMTTLGILDFLFPELRGGKQKAFVNKNRKKGWIRIVSRIQALDKLIHWVSTDAEKMQKPEKQKTEFRVQLGKFFPKMKEYLNVNLSADRRLASLIRFGGFYSIFYQLNSVGLDNNNQDRINNQNLDCTTSLIHSAQSLKLSNKEINFLERMISNRSMIDLLTGLKIPLSDREIYRYFKKTGDAGVAICMLALADELAAHSQKTKNSGWEKRLELSAKLFQGWWQKEGHVINPRLLITGDELQDQFGISPGPKIGSLLESLKEAQASGEVKTQKQAIKFIENLIRL